MNRLPSLLAVSSLCFAGSLYGQTPAATPPASLPTTNMVVNPSFEETAPAAITDSSIPGYTFRVQNTDKSPLTPDEVSLINDPAQAHSGNFCLRLQPHDRTLSFVSSPNSSLEPGLYEISAWMRGRNGTWGGYSAGAWGWQQNLIQLTDRWTKLGGYFKTDGYGTIDPGNQQAIDSASFNFYFGPASAKMAGLVDNLPNPQIFIDDLTIQRLTSGLSDAFGDHMVLQRDKPVPVWGWTKDANQKVTVKFNGQTVSTTSDKDGRWKVTLAPMKVGGPYVLDVDGHAAASDVMMGDVWICSGQSNMDFGIDFVHGYFNHAPDITDKADNPNIRLWTAPKQLSPTPMHDYLVRNDNINAPYLARWNVCTPGTVTRGVWGGFSAMGYFFAKEIQESEKVPIGLMMIVNGGTQIESFMSEESLKTIPQDQWIVQAISADDLKRNDTLPKIAIDAKVPTQAYSEALVRYTTPFGGQAGFDGNKDFQHPNMIYNGLVAPIVPMAVRGVIWFQGEHNAGDVHYGAKLKAMITDWRTKFEDKNMPFIIGQLCNLQSTIPMRIAREQQLQVAQTMPNTALAVSIDCANKEGDGNGPLEIHFNNKMDVGHRMALAARALSYGEKIVYSSPLYKSMKVEGDKVRLTFDMTGGTLDAKRGKLVGFTVAGDDKKFVDADAVIDGNSVVVSAAGVTNPVAVRYGFVDYFNPLGNLYNTDGLPASPFRTDDWPLDNGK